MYKYVYKVFCTHALAYVHARGSTLGIINTHLKVRARANAYASIHKNIFRITGIHNEIDNYRNSDMYVNTSIKTCLKKKVHKRKKNYRNFHLPRPDQFPFLPSPLPSYFLLFHPISLLPPYFFSFPSILLTISLPS